MRPWLAALLAAAVLVAVAAQDEGWDDVEEDVELPSETDAMPQDQWHFESFGPDWEKRWIHSDVVKYTGRFATAKPKGWIHPGIKAPEKSKHYGITTLLPQPIDPSAGLVVQYAVKYTEGITCGGAYIKLLTHSDDWEASNLDGSTPYTIMFGPDKCGGPGKVHLIFRHKNLLNGTISEHHLVNAPVSLADKETHLYTLQVKPDNTFKVWVDTEVKAEGSVFDALEPPIVPPKMIPDPSDVKPSDWVDDEKIPDPDATKPADWDDRKEVPDEDAVMPSTWRVDEPAMVDDKTAKKPEFWDDEEDGEWSPPQVSNPKCKKHGCGPWTRPKKANPAYQGAWSKPLIPNPDYKGPWVQKTIPNPDFYEDPQPLSHIGTIGALAIEIWTVDEGYTFGGFLTSQDLAPALQYQERVFKPLHEYEQKTAKARAEKEAKIAKKLQGKKDAQSRGSAAGLGKTIAAVFDTPLLSKVKPYIQPALDVVEAKPWAAWTLVLSPVAVSVLIVLMTVVWARKPLPDIIQRPAGAADAAADADDAGDDDDDAVPAATATGPAAKAAAKPSPAKQAEKKSEILADEAEDSEEEVVEAKAARRRARRAD